MQPVSGVWVLQRARTYLTFAVIVVGDSLVPNAVLVPFTGAGLELGTRGFQLHPPG
jgi:hypothetical protein